MTNKIKVCILAVFVSCGSARQIVQPLPNIIIIYADDLGYGDLSCYNRKSAYSTPRLDEMASEGVLFTDAHSPSTICSHHVMDFFRVNRYIDQRVREVLLLKAQADRVFSDQVS